MKKFIQAGKFLEITLLLTGLLVGFCGFSQCISIQIKEPSESPVVGAVTYLAALGTDRTFGVAITDSNGIARFFVRSYDGRSRIVIQAKADVDKRVSVELLQTEKLNSQLLVADTLPFYGAADVKYDVSEYVNFSTMEDVLREYVTPVGIRRRNGKFTPFIFDKLRRKPFAESPLVLVNGVPLLEATALLDIDPRRVATISIVDSRYFYGSEVFEGIISVTTKDMSLDDIDVAPGSLVLENVGDSGQ